MTSKIERVADGIRQVGAKTGRSRQDLVQAQRAARRMSQSAVAAGPAGKPVVALMQTAQRQAREAETALHEVAAGAESFARRLAGGRGGSSSVPVAPRGTAGRAEGSTAASVAHKVMQGTVNTVAGLGVAIDLWAQVALGNAALPPPNRFLPPAADLHVLISQEELVPWDKSSSSLNTAYGVVEEHRLEELTEQLGRRPRDGRGGR